MIADLEKWALHACVDRTHRRLPWPAVAPPSPFCNASLNTPRYGLVPRHVKVGRGGELTMTEPEDQATIPPFADADREPPVPPGEPLRSTEEAARRDLAMRGAVAGGAQQAPAGYATGAMTGTGGAIGARLTDADEGETEVEDGIEEAAEELEQEQPELEAQVSPGPPDTPGIDEPAQR
jgi:hypothetical protein